MLEAGVVVAVEGSRATVRMERSSACAECGLCHKLAHGTRDFVLSAANPRGAGPGDVVRVSVPDVSVVRAAFAAYGVPTLGAVLGGALGWTLLTRAGLSNETGATAGGIAGLVAAYYGVSKYDKWLRRTWSGPVIVEVLQSSAAEGGQGR